MSVRIILFFSYYFPCSWDYERSYYSILVLFLQRWEWLWWW